jgi:pimeloyl-ACP methyl ester carboxylesterase
MVSDAYVEIRGLRFHYREWGNQGQPVVLLHGLASTSHIWDLTAPLLQKEYRVLALDQRGHGKSDKPDEGYDFVSMTADLQAFCRYHGLQLPVVIGHSWGASVALEYAVANPEEVLGLVMVDGGYMEMSGRMSWEEAEQRLAPPQLDDMPLEEFLAMAQSWGGISEIWSPEVEHIVLANFEISKQQTIRPRLRRANHMKILRALWEQQTSQLFQSLARPALLAPARRQSQDEGEQRFLAVKLEAIDRLQQSLDGRVQIQWMEDSIHDVPVQRPQLLAGAINAFIGGLKG